MRKLFLLLLSLFFVGCSATSGSHLSVLSGKVEKQHQIDNSSIRGKVASLDSMEYMYAEHPIYVYNVDKNTFFVPVGGHFVELLNYKILQICRKLGGSAIEETIVTDSFTGEKSIKKSKANSDSDYWECVNNKNNFTVAKGYSLIKRLKPNDKKYYSAPFIVVETEKPEKPQLSHVQYNYLIADKEIFHSVTKLLNEKFSMMTAVGGGIALSHDKIGLTDLEKLADGSYEQTFSYDPDTSVVDAVRDFGILADLNAYCSYKGGYLKPLTTNKRRMLIEFGKHISNKVVYQCNSKSSPFYFKFDYATLAKEKPYKIILRKGFYSDIDKQKTKSASANLNSNQQVSNTLKQTNKPQNKSGLKAILAEKLAQKMNSANVNSTQLINTVSSETPHAVMDNPNYVLDIYWIRQNGACENIAVTKTYKISNDLTEIQNYLRCNGQVKKIQNTNLPVRLPDNLRQQQSSFLNKTINSGSFVYADTYSGITVIGRKADDHCKTYLFYMKGNKLLKAVQGGC